MNQEFNLQQVLRLVRRIWAKKWFILVPAVIGGAITTAFAISKPDIYRGEALLIAEYSTPSGGGVRRSEVDRTREILSSIGDRVYSDGFLLELIRTHELYPHLSNASDPDAAIVAARKDLTVAAQGNKGVVKIQYDYDIGEDASKKAAQAANHVAQYIVTEARDSVAEDSETFSAFYKKELGKATEKVRSCREALMAFRTKHEGTLPENRDSNQAEINSYQQTISLIGLKKDTLGDKITDLAGNIELAERDLYKARVAAGADAELAPRKIELDKLRLELVQMERKYTPESTQIRTMKERIASLDKHVKKLEKSGAENAPKNDPTVGYAATHLKGLQAQHKRAVDEFNNVDKTVQNANAGIARARARIARSYEIQTNYQSLDDNLEQAEDRAAVARREYEASALTTRFHEHDKDVVLQVQQSATPKSDPVGPQRLALGLVGLVAGMGLGLGVVFLRIQSDVTIRSRSDLKPLLPAAILVSIPEIVSMRSRVWRATGGFALGTCLAIVFLLTIGALGAKEGWWTSPEMVDTVIDAIKQRIASL